MTEEDDVFIRPATARTIDLGQAKVARHWRVDGRMREIIEDDRETTPAHSSQAAPLSGRPSGGVLLTPKQIRARARRRAIRNERMDTQDWDAIYKPIEEWDAEELARGRPRNPSGGFQGRPSKHIPRELHERAMEQFKSIIRTEMNVQTTNALDVLNLIMKSDEVDEKGKPIVPASTKLDAAKFLLEHVVGKPVQPTTSDVSVKLQGVLAAVMVNPAESAANARHQLAQYFPAHMGTRGEAIENVEEADWEENE